MRPLIRRYRFSTVLLVAFFSLSVPILSFVLIFSYVENTRSIREVLDFDLRRSEGAIVRTAVNFFSEAIGAVEGLAEVAADQPGTLRSPRDAGLFIPVPGLLLKAMKKMVERAAETSGRK